DRLLRFCRQIRPRRSDCCDQGAGRRLRTRGVMDMHDNLQLTDYATFTTAGQIFALPIERVQEVFRPSRITRVPLAGAQIAGVLNLRGRIVTAIDMRRRLELDARDEGEALMAIGIESGNESFGLLVDALGEVLKV